MAFRNELDAAQAHVESLKRENEQLQKQNLALQIRQPLAIAELPARHDKLKDRLAVGSATLMTLALASITVTGAGLALSLAALGCWALGMAGARRLLGVAAGPGEVLVLSGRQHTTSEGSFGFRIVSFGERVWRVPLMERIDRLDIRPFPVSVDVLQAYSSDLKPVDVTAHVIVRIDPTSPRVSLAVERFLGRPMKDTLKIAQEVIGAELRGIVGVMTGDEIRSQQIKMAGVLEGSADESLGKIGLRVESAVITKSSCPLWDQQRSGTG